MSWRRGDLVTVAAKGPYTGKPRPVRPMPYQAARDMEVELAIALQEEGYAVWQA